MHDLLRAIEEPLFNAFLNGDSAVSAPTEAERGYMGMTPLILRSGELVTDEMRGESHYELINLMLGSLLEDTELPSLFDLTHCIDPRLLVSEDSLIDDDYEGDDYSEDNLFGGQDSDSDVIATKESNGEHEGGVALDPLDQDLELEYVSDADAEGESYASDEESFVFDGIPPVLLASTSSRGEATKESQHIPDNVGAHGQNEIENGMEADDEFEGDESEGESEDEDEDDEDSDEDSDDDISSVTLSDEGHQGLINAGSPISTPEGFLISEEMWFEAKRQLKRAFDKEDDSQFLSLKKKKVRAPSTPVIYSDVSKGERRVSVSNALY